MCGYTVGMRPIEAVRGALRLASRWRTKSAPSTGDSSGAERVVLAMMRTSTRAARLMGKLPVPAAKGEERAFLERARAELGVMREHMAQSTREVDRAMVDMIDATGDLLGHMLNRAPAERPRELNVSDDAPTKVTF